MRVTVVLLLVALTAGCTSQVPKQGSPPPQMQAFAVPDGSKPHDVAPASDGGVWFTAQGAGYLGYLDPADGATRRIPLGDGSAPHGVIVGQDGAPWVTDGGLNAIVRVDPGTDEMQTFPVPGDRNVNLNTATFDNDGILWFTGQAGVYGRLDPATGEVAVYPAPGGPGPYGITTTPGGQIFYASLAGHHIAVVDTGSREAARIPPPTPDQGARRVWADSRGRVWVSEWDAGKVAAYTPGEDTWQEWDLPGDDPQPYAIFVDDQDVVWLSDFGANAIVRFDPSTERFDTFDLPSPDGNVRQLHGRPGEVWGAESGADALIVLRTS